MQKLRTSVQFLKNIGPKRKGYLENLGVANVFDLFWHLPRDYEDFSLLAKIDQLRLDDNARIRATILDAHRYRTRSGLQILKATITDGSSETVAVWFNQNFLFDQLNINSEFILKGKLKAGYNGIEFNVYEAIPINSATPVIMPVYPLTANINNQFLHNLIGNLLSAFLNHYPDIIHTDLQTQYQLPSISETWQSIHFPASKEKLLAAQRRLTIEELFLLRCFTVPVFPAKKQALPTKNFTYPQPALPLKLPFTLTDAQKRVLEEIYQDMKQSKPMNRLLQGDVGSGKTAVAAMTIAKAVNNGYQACFMVPTEILAQQHFRTLSQWFEHASINIALLTSATTPKNKQSIMKDTANGTIDILIGTQAMIQDKIKFKNLSLAVIDEQQRFGVKQRALLQDKGTCPDILVMTATPIPRTLALTFYGQLSISVIDSLPQGRLPVKTKFLDYRSRRQAYLFIRQQLLDGGQAYVVCPLIEESEKLDLRAAENIYQELQAFFADTAIKIGLLHGRMTTEEKQSLITAFQSGSVQLLVSTTVIEVGVDVPTATVILVEQAERFGLAQLHQLRGRVGRSGRQSYCILLGNPGSGTARQRLQAMETHQDGFSLANIDLSLRGPGEFWGVRQHGLAHLQILDFSRDQALIEEFSALLPLIYEKLPQPEILEEYLALKFGSYPIANN